jgi:hypothetical protein
MRGVATVVAIGENPDREAKSAYWDSSFHES